MLSKCVFIADYLTISYIEFTDLNPIRALEALPGGNTRIYTLYKDV